MPGLAVATVLTAVAGAAFTTRSPAAYFSHPQAWLCSTR